MKLLLIIGVVFTVCALLVEKGHAVCPIQAGCQLPKDNTGANLTVNAHCQFLVPNAVATLCIPGNSPNGGNYADNMNCRYQFVGPAKASRLHVSILNVDIEKTKHCSNDKLIIRGTEPFHDHNGAICGTKYANTKRYGRCLRHKVAYPITAAFISNGNGITGKGFCIEVRVLGWPC